MIAIVEDYIFKMKGVNVTINKNIINNARQLMMLHLAFNIANGN